MRLLKRKRKRPDESYKPMLDIKCWKVSSIRSSSSFPFLLSLATSLPCCYRISNRLNRTCWVLSSNDHQSFNNNLLLILFLSLLFLPKSIHLHQLQHHSFDHHHHHLAIKSENDVKNIISFFEPLVLLLMTKRGEG